MTILKIIPFLISDSSHLMQKLNIKWILKKLKPKLKKI
jgi:hypothetical protein